MARLRNLGPTPTADQDVEYKSHLDTLLGANLTQAQVDALIVSGFSPYATRSYVDSRDAFNATQAYVDAGDATRLHLSQRGANNGVAPLESNGRIAAARLPIDSTQRWPRPYYSPAAYGSGSSGAYETTLYTHTVTYPGFTYKLLVHGDIDVYGTHDGASAPVIYVRAHSASGELIAGGLGSSEYYRVQPYAGWGSAGDYGYSIPGWCRALDCVVLGGGAGGQGGWGIVIPFNGIGGGAGSWNGVRLTRGANLPWETGSISVHVGAAGSSGAGGGYPGGDGGASWISATGYGTLTGGGGAHAASGNHVGLSPGNANHAGVDYYGGGEQGNLGYGGNPYGGGGAGGAGALIGGWPGGTGAPGAVWITPLADDDNIARATATIIPVGFDNQPSHATDTTLYINLLRSGGSGTVYASPKRPKLWICPVPA